MPSLCELKIEAKKRGLKGYSVMKKAELENLLDGAGSSEKKETPPKKIKKIKMNIKRPEKKKPEMPKALATEWSDLQELGTGDIYSIIFEDEVEDLARRKEPKTEKQQSKILDQAGKIAGRAMNKLFKASKKGAKMNEDIMRNMKKLFEAGEY